MIYRVLCLCRVKQIRLYIPASHNVISILIEHYHDVLSMWSQGKLKLIKTSLTSSICIDFYIDW